MKNPYRTGVFGTDFLYFGEKYLVEESADFCYSKRKTEVSYEAGAVDG